MKLDEGEIRQMVSECNQDRAKYCAAAEHWENIWRMEPYEESSNRTSREIDGVERVRLADGYNIVQLAMRFISSDLRVEIPYLNATDSDETRSELMEEWCTSFWTRASRQLGTNVINSMSWQSCVRGRGALQVLWVKDVLPKNLRDSRLPILPRPLDPMNVGSKQGPYYTDYAYHEYDAATFYVKQNYPDYEIEDRGWHRDKTTCKVVDMWYRGNAGEVWNAVTIDGKFAKNCYKTDYPEIPIIEWTGDGAPLEELEYQSLSILHPLKDLYKYKCDLASGIGTALLYSLYPIITLLGVNQDIQVGPGQTVRLPDANAKIDVLRLDPNTQLSETMLTMVDQQIQQATFPSVMYGEGMGNASGYAINQLGQAARGRINVIRENQESALERANELLFQLVEVFGGDEGVKIWGKSAYEGRGKPLVLKAKDIKENYANDVRLIPEIPADETQRITTWLQLVKEQIISKATFRDRILNVPIPRDEDTRVTIDQVMMTPEMGQKKSLRALQSWYGKDTWEILIAGTPLEQVQKQEQAMIDQKAAEKEAAKLARKEERDMKSMMGNLPPELMQMMMAGGPPPGMGGGMMPPGAPSGMPPEGIGGPPPGMMPEGMPPMMPPGGDMSMGGPPPEMGGMTPEMMGIPPTGGPPGMYQELTGQPLTDEEMQRRLMEQGGGLPPEGMM